MFKKYLRTYSFFFVSVIVVAFSAPAFGMYRAATRAARLADELVPTTWAVSLALGTVFIGNQSAAQQGQKKPKKIRKNKGPKILDVPVKYKVATFEGEMPTVLEARFALPKGHFYGVFPEIQVPVRVPQESKRACYQGTVPNLLTEAPSVGFLGAQKTVTPDAPVATPAPALPACTPAFSAAQSQTPPETQTTQAASQPVRHQGIESFDQEAPRVNAPVYCPGQLGSWV